MYERFHGIVLFSQPYREHDGLVKIFTQERGTKMFFVRGLNRVNNPLKPQLLPVTENEYIGTLNENGLSFLNEARTLNFYQKVQSDYIQQAYAIYFLQLVDAAVDDNVAHPQLYQLLSMCLQSLESGLQPEIIATYLEIHLLPVFGIGLHWRSCVICQSTKEPFDMSIRKMGLLCTRHFSEDEFRLQTHPRTMHIANLLSQVSLQQIQSIELSASTLAEIRQLMEEIYDEFVGLRLKSYHYLQQLLTLDDSVEKLKLSRQEKDQENS